jgi:hypothetical protein
MKRKIKIKRKKSNPSLKKIPISTKPIEKTKLKRIVIVGRWCEYIEGRLPYPIECSYNKNDPVQYIFKGNKKKKIKNTPNCKTCNRYVKYDDWKLGKWKKVEEEIKKGADLIDQPSPVVEKE